MNTLRKYFHFILADIKTEIHPYYRAVNESSKPDLQNVSRSIKVTGNVVWIVLFLIIVGSAYYFTRL